MLLKSKLKRSQSNRIIVVRRQSSYCAHFLSATREELLKAQSGSSPAAAVFHKNSSQNWVKFFQNYFIVVAISSLMPPELFPFVYPRKVHVTLYNTSIRAAFLFRTRIITRNYLLSPFPDSTC